MTQTLRALAAARPRLLLILFCLLCWLPGWFTLPPGDRDESRFAQASKQMLERGDFVRIQNGDVARNRKPIGIYWLQLPGAAAARALGLATDNPVWPYRLPSLAGALLAVLATHALGRRLFGPPAALLGAGLLAGSTVLGVEARNATTDAALLAATTLTMLPLAEAYRAGALAPGRAALVWLALGAGVLIKGPVTPLVAGLTVATLALADRKAAWLRALLPGWGIPLLLAVVLPWFVAIGLATGGQFLRESVGGDLAGKLTGGDDAHGAPPGFHLLLLSLTLFPAGWAVLRALPGAWAARRDPATRFLLAWAGPAWLVFEAVPTKLPHYPLPLAPALCLLAAGWLLDPARRPPPRWLERVSLGLFLLAATALGLAAAAVPVLVGAAWWRGLPALLAAGAVAALVGRFLRAGRPARAAIAGMLAAVPLQAAFLGLEAPRLAPIWLAPRVRAALAADDVRGDVAALGFAEPSLMFLCGTNTRMLNDAATARRFLAASPGRAVVVEQRALQAFLSAAPEDPAPRPRQFAEVTGVNYSNGRRVRLLLFDLAPSAGPSPPDR